MIPVEFGKLAIPRVLFLLPTVVPAAFAQKPQPFRPPAVPLVTHDPYFSVWSMNDKLTDDWTKHWTGANHAMCGMARVDGQTYRFLAPEPREVPAMEQVSLEVLPTRTIYQFEAGDIHLTLTFMSPLLPHDLDLLARPVTYLTWDVRSMDNRSHPVSLYFDCSAEWGVNSPEQKVVWSRLRVGDLRVLCFGSQEQPILEKSGDNLRIDWGYFYLAIPRQEPAADVITRDRHARRTFVSRGRLPESDDLRMPRPASDDWPVLACTFDLGSVGKTAVSRHILLAYDDLFSIEYFYRKLRPYWRRNGMEADELLRTAAQDYAPVAQKCKAFDEELMADLAQVGGEPYACLAALAYRQTVAAYKLVADYDGRPLFFPKENFSNGCISTVDVIYPSSPFFLLFNTELLRAQLTPVLEYARSPHWPHPFAPHDLGTYPLANGQVYGGGERSEENQMPVEECGNMLLMLAAMAKIDGNADYAAKYWPIITRWAEYLKAKGLDPENQLCTDDFAGHLAHNANLSIKAIEALGGYAMLCELLGKKDDAAVYRQTANAMAQKWLEMANDGDHYRLAFDQPGTWSQKYNLAWDKLLELNLFSPEVPRREVAFYKTKLNPFGLPLDHRQSYTKLDWELWTATLAESAQDFELFIARIYQFANHSPSRVPLTDWYWTLDAKQVGFQARSVVGGIYIKMLSLAAVWQKWAWIAR